MIDETLFNRVYCCVFENMFELIPDESIQLLFTSPPYEDMVNYRDGKGEVIAGKIVGQEFINLYWTGLFKEAQRCMKKDGTIVINTNDKVYKGVVRSTNIRGILAVEEMGWYMIENIKWFKTNGSQRGPHRLQDWYEHIYCFSRDPENVKIYPDRVRGEYSETSKQRYGYVYKQPSLFGGEINVGGDSVAEIGEAANRVMSKEGSKRKPKEKTVALNEDGKLMPNVIMVSPDKRKGSSHTARFPFDLPRLGIVLFTDKGDVVCDPFCGSGTTLSVAKEMERHYIGCDISDEYVKEAEILISKTDVQIQLVPTEDSIKLEV